MMVDTSGGKQGKLLIEVVARFKKEWQGGKTGSEIAGSFELSLPRLDKLRILMRAN